MNRKNHSGITLRDISIWIARILISTNDSLDLWRSSHLFYYSVLGWIRLRNECGVISDYLHSSNAMALEPQNIASCMFWKEAPPRYRENEFSPTSNSSTSTDIQWPDIGTGDDMGPSSMIELDSLDSIGRLNLNE